MGDGYSYNVNQLDIKSTSLPGEEYIDIIERGYYTLK